ncbi:hypothetical protein O0L34_g4505 [Tuta absoluta]|nr:hypothetical protein O0L34_g4505 [Tuta absoluta]
MDLPQDSSRMTQPQQPVIKLNTINLENLHTDSERISAQLPVNLNQANEISLYHTTIPIYTLLFGACLVSAGLVLRRVIKKRRTDVQPETHTTMPTYAEIPEKPKRSFKPEEITLSHLSAAFSPSTSNSC